VKNVILIENNPHLRSSLTLLLALNFYKVISADSPTEALKILNGTSVDLVISESFEKRSGGIKFLQSLRDDEILREIPCLMLSSFSDHSEVQKLLSAGAASVVMKPFKTRYFLDEIERLIGKSIAEEQPVLVCHQSLSEDRDFIRRLRKHNIQPVFESNLQNIFELLTVRKFSGMVFEFGSDDETGVRVVEWIRTNEEILNLPFIAIGEGSDAVISEKIIAAGADDFYNSPFQLEDLVNELSAKIHRYDAYCKRQHVSDTNATDFEEYEIVAEERRTALKQRARSRHILIIEDDMPLSENLEMQLKLNSFTVTKTDRGLRGIELASLRMPDLIICDVMLPDIDGFLVLEELNKKISTSSIPFIFLSAKSEISDVRRGMVLGANSYVTKPFSAGKLLQLISLQLEKTQYANILKHKSEINVAEEPVNKSIESRIEQSKHPSAFTPAKPLDATHQLKDLFKKTQSEGTRRKTKTLVEVPPALPVENVPEPETPPLPSKNAILDVNNIFIAERDFSQDIQKFAHQDIVVILVNLERAVEREGPKFKLFLLEVLNQKTKKIIIDFGSVNFVDSIFIGVLVALRRTYEMKGCIIKLVINDDKIFSNPLIHSGLSKTFEIYHDIPTAISSFTTSVK
jgi:DNA-binding response OmpR family regulator/anti-anti-sigma regulatory factor